MTYIGERYATEMYSTYFYFSCFFAIIRHRFQLFLLLRRTNFSCLSNLSSL